MHFGRSIFRCIYIDTPEIRFLGDIRRTGEDTGRAEIAGACAGISVPGHDGDIVRVNFGS